MVAARRRALVPIPRHVKRVYIIDAVAWTFLLDHPSADPAGQIQRTRGGAPWFARTSTHAGGTPSQAFRDRGPHGVHATAATSGHIQLKGLLAHRGFGGLRVGVTRNPPQT